MQHEVKQLLGTCKWSVSLYRLPAYVSETRVVFVA